MGKTTKYHCLDSANSHQLLTADVFDNPVSSDFLEMFLADKGHQLVFATAGDTVIGFASGATLLHPDKAPSFFINEVDVAPEYQRQGIASALCEMLMEVARDKGCDGAWLATEEDNGPARGLYQSLNGRETEAVVVYDWDDALDK